MNDRNRWDSDRNAEGRRQGEYGETRSTSRRDRDDDSYYRSDRGSRNSGSRDYPGEMTNEWRDPRYDERSEYQASGQRYAGTGYSNYGSGASGQTGDYFGSGDYGSGAYAWDHNGPRSPGSGRYASQYNASGLTGNQGTRAEYGRDTGRGQSLQSWQRESYGGSSGYGDSQQRGFLDRASDEVMSWFGDEDAARRREADHRGHGPADYTRSDERIREDANDRLTDDPRVDARNVTVSVEGGELTLSGTVPNRDAKRRAEDCVEAISGVSHVQNNLRVQASDSAAATSSANGASGWASTTRSTDA